MPSRVALIVGAVCEFYGMTREQLMAKDRHKLIARARAIAMRLVRDEGYSFPEIGTYFGRDHTTVMSACKRAAVGVVRERQWSDDMCGILTVVERMHSEARLSSTGPRERILFVPAPTGDRCDTERVAGELLA